MQENDIRAAQAASPKFPYLGRHTAVPHLLSGKSWRGIPMLRDNQGQLPPFVICVGDRRRVADSADMLNLSGVCFIDNCAWMEKRSAHGRVAVISGAYDFGGLRVPLLVLESQMGVPAVCLNVYEVAAHLSYGEFHFEGETFKPNKAYVIRAGTAGGINDPQNRANEVAVGDIVNASFSIGYSGSVMQALGGLNFAHPDAIAKFATAWGSFGYGFTQDNEYPQGSSTPEVVRAISDAGKALGVRVLEGGNFTKDSLYAEADEAAFIGLRTKYGVLSTEMEQIGIMHIAGKLSQAGYTLAHGLVSGIVGVLPGASFARDENEENRAAEVEVNIIRAAAEALSRLAAACRIEKKD